MRQTRVNIGVNPYINEIIDEDAYAKGESRSGLIRLAIKQRYKFKDLILVEGPFNVYMRVNIPREGAAHVRKLAYKNNVPISSIYCAIIKRYIHGS